MVIRYGIFLAVLSLLAFACKEEKPPELKKVQPPVVVFNQKHPVLTSEQRADLDFPADILSQGRVRSKCFQLRSAAGQTPFHITASQQRSR